MRRFRRRALRVVLLALVITALWVWRGPVVRALGLPVASLATGYGIGADGLAFDSNTIDVDGLHVTRGGLPLLDAAHVRAKFDPWALLAGRAGRGSHLALDLTNPELTLTRRPDGSFGLPRSSAATPARPPAPGATPAPLDVDVAVRGGRITIVDDSRRLPESRRFTLDGIAGNIRTTGSRTAGELDGTLSDADAGPAKLRLSVVSDAVAASTVVRLESPRIALRAPVDYLINSTIAPLGGGVLSDVDVRWYAFASGASHVAGSARLDDASIEIPGLITPLSALGADLGFTDDSVTFRHGSAALGDLQGIRVAGGIYDFSAPQFDFGLAVDRADLGSIARLFAFSRRMPVRGAGRVDVRLRGPVGSPLVAIGLDLPDLGYARYPVRTARGAVVYYDGSLELANVRASYGALDLSVDGAIGLTGHTTWQLSAITSAPSAGIPYLAQALPEAETTGAGLMTGVDTKIGTRGVLWGEGRSGRVAGTYYVEPTGVGSLGPIAVRRADGSDLAGALLLDRPTGTSGFWLDTHGVAFANATPVTLPGLANFKPPRFAGRFDGDLAGVTSTAGFRLRGHLHGTDVSTGPVRIADVDTRVAGALDRLTLTGARARGPFGTFAGSGLYAGTTLVLDGTYDGSFEAIRPFTGDLGAHGAIHGPVALAMSPDRTVVQARDVRTPGALVRGVPVETLAGSLVATSSEVRVFAARAGLAGGTIAGAGGLGSSASGDGRLAVSVDRLDAARLRGTGLGLASGRLAGYGTVSLRGAGRSASTDFDGGFSVADASVPARGGAPFPASGNGFLMLTGDRVSFRDASGIVAGAAGFVDGSVTGVGRNGDARYDLGVLIPSAEAGALIARYAPESRGDEATVEGRLRVTGPASAPEIHGRLDVPQGMINGLNYAAVSGDVDGSSQAIALRHGTARVGTTDIAFSGGQVGDDGNLRVSSPKLNLADFDDYFDEGDALAGRGQFLVRFRRHNGLIETQADTDLRDVRVRSFALGDASAHWYAHGPRVTGRLAFGGASGTLDVSGTVDLARRAALQKILASSRFDGTARLRDLDLGVWLPAIGLQMPVTGRLDGDAIVRGAYPGFDLRTTATLRSGTIDHLPVSRFSIAADSTLARTTITAAELDLPGLALTGSGVVGIGARGTVDVKVHGASDDIGALALRLGTGLPVTGAAEADVHIDGPRTRPRISGGFDLEHAMAGPIAIPQALGEFQIQGRDLVLTDSEISFTKSTLYLAGSLPLEVAPFGFGPAAAPITLELQTKDLELSDFAPLLPRDSTLTGRIDGRVRIGGTAGAPQLYGSLALANGTIAAPAETVPVRDLAANIAFAGRQMTLEKLAADVGGGTLSANGNVTFADLVRPGNDASYAFAAQGRRLFLDLPAYGRGTIDGNLRLSHEPGSLPTLAGEATLSDAVIPFSALYVVPSAPDPGTIAGPPTAPVDPTGRPDPDAVPVAAPQLEPQDLALALDVTADRNVRVRSGNVDIGGKGSLEIRGTKAAPVLSGSFDSTGGTLTYFNTLFRVQRGTVTFDPEAGIVPNLDARATSHVSAPDPRNLSGSADVTIDLTGPVSNLSIQLSSDPPYSRDQILGLLFSVPSLGGSSLLANQSQTALTPGVEAPQNGTVRSANGDISVGQEAFGVLNAQFTRNLLAPFESAFSESLGISDLNVNVDYSGQVGFTARKFLGHKVDAVFADEFGYPEQRQSFGFEFRPNNSFAAQITAFQSIGQQLLGVQTPDSLLHSTSINPRLTSAEPIGGTQGFSLSLQRLF